MRLRDLRPRLPGTLRGRLVLGVAAVHAVMMTLFIADTTTRQRALLLERQEEGAVALSRSLSTSAAGWLAADDISGLQELVEAQRRYPELAFAILANEDGLILAHTDKARAGLYLLDLPREARETVLGRSRGLVDAAAPAFLGGEHVGWARVGLSQQAASDSLTRIALNGALYAAAAIVIGAAMAWLMGRQITARLYAVQETIGELRAGNRAARSRIAGSDEAASIAREFNVMLDARDEQDSALARTEARYRGLLRSIEAAVIVHGADTRILMSNPKASELLGLTEEQLLGKASIDPVWRFLREDGSPLPVDEYPVNRVLSARRPLRDLVLGVQRPGRERPAWVLVNATPIADTKETSTEVAVTFIDITERKLAAQELARLHTELEQRVLDRTALLEAANKELDAFAHSVSHDLRAPLRHIGGFIELMKQQAGAGLDPQASHYLEVITEAANGMGRMIDDLLAFSRMGRAELVRTSVDVGALVREVMAELGPDLTGRSIDWKVGTFPPVGADRQMLRLALANLLSNAVKFTRTRPRAEIEVACTEPPGGAEVVIFVRDNGVGFDMRYVDKLFKVFQRLHRAEEFEGTGVGLANVRRIVERHGGRTWAVGAPGEGTTFFLSLPVQRGPA